MKKSKRKYQKEGSRGKCEILVDNQVVGRTIKLDGMYLAFKEDGTFLGKFPNLRGAERNIVES